MPRSPALTLLTGQRRQRSPARRPTRTAQSKARPERASDVAGFSDLCEARLLIESWRQFYNHEPPHSALGYAAREDSRSTANYCDATRRLNGYKKRTHATFPRAKGLENV